MLTVMAAIDGAPVLDVLMWQPVWSASHTSDIARFRQDVRFYFNQIAEVDIPNVHWALSPDMRVDVTDKNVESPLPWPVVARTVDDHWDAPVSGAQ